MAEAIFAGGCFWCVEAVFKQLRGVTSVESGYIGGSVENPTYKAVCSGTTGHAEAIRIGFDESVIGYADLLDIHFATHDPTQLNRQGPDTGTQYRSAIFVHDAAQEATARASLGRLQASGRYRRNVVTQIVPAAPFYRAEEYHQRYFEKHGSAHCKM